MADPLKRRALIARAFGGKDLLAPLQPKVASWTDAFKGWFGSGQHAGERNDRSLAGEEGGQTTTPAKGQRRRRAAQKRGDSDLQRALRRSKADARKRLARVLELYQAKLRSVVGDGNCQFRALAVGLYASEGLHTVIRTRVVEQLKAEPELYGPFVAGAYADYVRRMARDAEWGDHVTLQAASDAFGCEIHVLTDQPGSECVVLTPSGPVDAGQKPICLTLVTEVHYDAAEIS